MNLRDCLTKAAARLPNEQLLCELQCAESCALVSTRTRREAALLRAGCLRLELERRRLAASVSLTDRASVRV